MKAIITLGLVLLFGNSVWAQFGSVKNDPEKTGYERKGKMEFGLQHSINFVSLVGEGPTTSFGVIETKFVPVGVRLTASVGGFGNYYLTEKLSFQFEFMFAFYGSHFSLEKKVYHDLGYFESTSKKTYAMRYIKLPLTLNYLVADNFYVQGGGYFSTLINARSYENLWSFGPNVEDVNNLNPIDIGLIGGVGIETKVVRIGVRYSYGFLNVFDNYGTADLHNSVFEVSAHWKLNKK